MSLPLILACLWVFAATAMAFMPMKTQMKIGFPMLASAVGLIIWIGAVHGFWLALAGLLAVLSMFRKPLIYFGRRAFVQRGEKP